MILIKFLSLLLLLPSIYVLRKLLKKEDVNFFDLLIVFSTLYFVVVPLKSDKLVYDSMGTLSDSISILVFLYLWFFFISLLIASALIKKENNSPINLTYYLKRCPELKAGLLLKIILVALPIFSLTYYVPHMSAISAFNEIQQAGVNITYKQSSMIKFFGTVFRLGLTITVVLFFQNIKNKNYNILVVVSLLLFLTNLLMLSRRQLLLFFLFGAIIFYSWNRELINKKLITYALGFGVFLYFIYFPFYNIIRRSPVEFNLSDPISSITAIYNYGINSYSDANESAAELTDSRAIGLYRAIYWLVKNDADYETTWGRITLSAIDHAVPKVINPGKGTGSEHLLEERMHTKYDSADSVLLLALADYSMLGAIFTVLIYFIVYKIWFFIFRCSEFFFGKTIVSFYLIFFLFRMTFSIEQKLDGILADTVAYVLVIVLIVLLHKLDFVRMVNTEKELVMKIKSHRLKRRPFLN